MQYQERASRGLFESKKSSLRRTYVNIIEEKINKAENIMTTTYQILSRSNDKSSVNLDINDISVFNGKELFPTCPALRKGLDRPDVEKLYHF